MSNINYRALLDNTDVMAKLLQIEQGFVRVGSRATITVNVAGLPAARNALNNLGGNRTLNYRVNTIGNIGGLTGQLAAAEARMRSLTLAAGQNLGVTRALGGIFAFIPGPLGLYASAASLATGALTGLNAAQKLNTIGAFALVGGLAAIGAATALLASRGIEQLKAYQSAVNVLNVAGGGSAGLDAQLRALQEQGGKPAQQFNRAELAQGIAELTKQGLSEAEAFKLVGTSYKLAGAEGEKLNVSSTLLLANLRQFGQTTESAAKYGDILAKGSLLAASGAKELQEGLSVVGPVADKAGLSIEETTANLIALDNTGLKANTVGANAFRAVLLALLSPSGKAKDEIKKLGVELKNSDGSARSVRDVLIDLRKAALQSGEGYDSATKSALGQADSVSAIASIFRSRGVVGFLNMTGAVDKYNDALQGSTGTLDQYADELTKGPAAAQVALKKSLDDLALSFAQTFGPKLTAGLDGLTGFFRDLDKLTQNKDVIQSYFTAVIVGIGGVTAALILNSEAAKGLLAVNSWSGFVTLLQGTVAGGLYAKAAAGLRALALATALNTFANGGNKVLGFITALNGVPIAAGAALAGVALLAAGVAVATLKILGDIKKIQDETETGEDKALQSTLAQVAAYRKAGDALSQQKAKTLLARQALEQAQAGQVVVPTVFQALTGRVVQENKVDDAEVAKRKAVYLAEVKNQEAVRIATEAAAASNARLGGGTKNLTTEVKAASVQFGVLSDKLSDLSRKFGDSKLTTFETNLRQSREELKRFSTEVENAVKKGSVSPAEGKNLLSRASGLQARNIEGLTQRQLDEDAKTQTQHEQEIAAARLSIIKDARVKRQGEYAAEIVSLNEKYAPQIKEALQNATAKGITPAQKRSLQDDAGKLQGQQSEALRAAAAKLTSDLNDLDEERTKKVRDGATQRLQTLASEMSQNATSLEEGYKHAEELAGDDVKARLAVERTLAPQLEASRKAARLSKLKGDQAALNNEYDDAVRAARDQGSARVRLETEARETYLSKGRALQKTYETDVQGYAEARLQAIQVAGAAVTKQQLELNLAGVKQFTGAQLAAYTALYEAKRKAALAEGDPAKAKEFADALKTLSDTKFSNLTDFKKQVQDAVNSLSDLRSKLADLNPNKDPLQQARSSAASPFNTLLDTAKKAQIAGQNVFNGLTPEQQAQQATAFKQQQAELSRFILDANRQRGVALLTADQDFNSKRLQKAQESALKLSKTEYDRSKDSGPYLAALAQDTAFWQARLKIAKAGSQEEADAQQHLADDTSARQQVLATDRQIAETRRTLARDEAQSALELAATEKERNRGRAELISSDAQRLAALPAEIQAARARGESEEQIATLVREQLALRGNLKKYGDEDLARADEQLSHQRGLLETELELATSDAQRLTLRSGLLSADQTALQTAQARLDKAISEGATLEKIAGLEDKRDAAAKNVKADHEADLAVVNGLLQSQLQLQASQDGYAAAVARSNAEVLSAKQSSLDTSRAELAQIGQRIAQAQQDGKSQTEINGLLSEYTQKQTGIYEQQKGIRTYLTGLDRQSLDLLEAQARSQAEITGASGDTTKAKLLDLDTTRKNLAFADRQLASADQNLLTEQEINDLKKTRLGLLGQEAQQQRDLVQLGLQRRQGELDLSKARAGLGLEQSGLGDSAPAAAQAALDAAQKQLAIARDRVTAASNLDDLTKAQTDEVTVETAALVAQRALVKARIDDESKTLGLLKVQEETRLALAGLDDNAVAKAQLGLDTANRELAASREQLALAKTVDERRDAQTRNEGAVLGQLQARRALIQAGLDADQHQLELLRAQSAARLILNRQNDDAVATAQESVRQAQGELDLARERVRLAQTPIQRQDAQSGELTAQAALVSAQQQLALAPLEGEQRHLNLLKAQVAERLELAGLQSDGVATGEAAVAQAQAELALAQRRLALSQTQAQQEDAQAGVSTARVALSQAERGLVQARADAEQKAFDLLEAQVRGRAQLTRLADDAVASAQIDLDVTRGKLGLVDRQLASAQSNRLTQEQISGLLKDQISLQGQAVQQEDKLLDAQRARVTLLAGLNLAQSKLGNEVQGGAPEARNSREAINGVTEARLKLTQAERAYGEAQADLSRSQSSSNLEKFRSATEGLTSAIAGQRSAMSGLVSQYAALLSNQDNVRSASETLKKALYGDADQPFDGNKELDRFSAIQTRRNAALRAAQEALRSGDASRIAQTTDELAKQEERYRKQAELLKTNGVDVALQSEAAVAGVADQVDRLGIQYDREADLIKQKAEVAARESEAAVVLATGAGTFQQGAGVFDSGVNTFGEKIAELADVLNQPLKVDVPVLKVDTSPIPPVTADRALLNALEKLDAEDRQSRGQSVPSDAARARAAATERAIAADNALNRKYFGPGGLVDQNSRGGAQSAPTPVTRSQLAADIAFALRPNANTVQRAVNESLSKIRNISPLVNPGSAQTGGRTVNNNQAYTFTINAAPGQSAEDIGYVVDERLRQINREAEIFAECP